VDIWKEVANHGYAVSFEFPTESPLTIMD